MDQSIRNSQCTLSSFGNNDLPTYKYTSVEDNFYFAGSGKHLQVLATLQFHVRKTRFKLLLGGLAAAVSRELVLSVFQTDAGRPSFWSDSGGLRPASALLTVAHAKRLLIFEKKHWQSKHRLCCTKISGRTQSKRVRSQVFAHIEFPPRTASLKAASHCV